MRIITPPPEPYWTDKIVMAYMEEAAEIHRCIPEVKVPGYHSVWPDTLKDDWERYYDMRPYLCRFWFARLGLQ